MKFLLSKLSVKNSVPKLHGYSKANKSIFIVMLHVINFHVFGPSSLLRIAMMKEIMNHIITNVTAEDSSENHVCKL